ncbi:MAG TPA: RNA 2',3'-cyclic phosphodiesterase [Gammaproteobacteria bacterium]|jgi:2'-5' RNA ligase|nr:RNA 2',3'-cyclic phosphodiesterase [Gammaproteobacteria bacterium]
MRCFIALSLSEDARDTLGDVAAKMAYQDKSNAVRWVDQENFHVTLGFLGELGEEEIERLADELDTSLSSFGAETVVSGISPFPETKPKLIAAMLNPSDSLSDIHQQTLAAINTAQLAYDKRRFLPHVTLGRLRHSRNRYSGSIPLTFTLPIEFDEVVLYESHLGTNGAEYDPVFRYPLEFMDYENDEYDQPDYSSEG